MGHKHYHIHIKGIFTEAQNPHSSESYVLLSLDTQAELALKQPWQCLLYLQDRQSVNVCLES